LGQDPTYTPGVGWLKAQPTPGVWAEPWLRNIENTTAILGELGFFFREFVYVVLSLI
jgi:hypothetical protein